MVKEEQKRSGCSFNRRDSQDFVDFIQSCELFDLNLTDRSFTWFDNRVQ